MTNTGIDTKTRVCLAPHRSSSKWTQRRYKLTFRTWHEGDIDFNDKWNQMVDKNENMETVTKSEGKRSPSAINIQEWAAGTVLAPRSWEGTDYCRKILAASIGCTFVTGAKLT